MCNITRYIRTQCQKNQIDKIFMQYRNGMKVHYRLFKYCSCPFYYFKVSLHLPVNQLMLLCLSCWQSCRFCKRMLSTGRKRCYSITNKHCWFNDCHLISSTEINVAIPIWSCQSNRMKFAWKKSSTYLLSQAFISSAHQH